MLRDGQSPLGIALCVLSAGSGRAYTNSPGKRALDIAVGLPVAALGLPVALILAAFNKLLQPRLAPWFVQHRVGQAGSQRIVKLRSMLPRGEDTVLGHHLHEQARVTPLGRLMRRYDLDEMPQLVDVLNGSLSLVGIRVLPRPVYEHLREIWSAARFREWEAAYQTSRLGLTGIHQVYRGVEKADGRRYHRDVFYASHASLGLDLYVLWRTAYRLGRRMSRARRGRPADH